MKKPKAKCLDLKLLPNTQQADLLARSAAACAEIRRIVSYSRYSRKGLKKRFAKGSRWTSRQHLWNVRDIPFLQDMPGIQDVPEEILEKAFDEALEDADLAPGKAIEELNGFSLVYPELATLDPRARQVRLVDFAGDLGTLPCQKFKGHPAPIENIFVFRDAAAWYAKVFFEA